MEPDHSRQKKKEILLFLFLAVFLAPTLAIVGIGGYGFIFWMLQ